MQAIRINEATAVLISLRSEEATLVVTGASSVAEDEWDEVIRFCWAAGWEPRQDDADAYFPASDTEFYALVDVDEEDLLFTEAVDEGDREHG